MALHCMALHGIACQSLMAWHHMAWYGVNLWNRKQDRTTGGEHTVTMGQLRVVCTRNAGVGVEQRRNPMSEVKSSRYGAHFRG